MIQHPSTFFSSYMHESGNLNKMFRAKKQDKLQLFIQMLNMNKMKNIHFCRSKQRGSVHLYEAKQVWFVHVTNNDRFDFLISFYDL